MRILAAYKPSAQGPAVLAAATEEARLRGADLLIARHAKHQPSARLLPQPQPQAPSIPASADDVGQDIDKLREETEALASSVHGVPCEAVLLEEGDDAAAAILELASGGYADLIVVGIRHRSRVGKAVLGSEAQRILLEAACPVLAVKATEG